MVLYSESVINLPTEDVERSCGLAVDIGSTIAKVAYRSKKEYRNGKPINPKEKGCIHYAMFPRTDINSVVSYVKENCDLVHNENGNIIVNAAGTGSAHFRTEFEAGLNCSMKIYPEFDCFYKAFLKVEKTLAEDELYVKISPEAQKRLDQESGDQRSKLRAQMVKLRAHTDMKFHWDDEKTCKETDTEVADRPRLMLMAGSGTGLMQLNNDGTFKMLDGTYLAGRYMYGLASLLTGENDFGKLIEMAEESDGRSCDTWISDIMGNAGSSGKKDNVYAEAASQHGDRMAFPFGKGIYTTLDRVKKGDLAHSVFQTTAMVHAQLVTANARLTNAKQLYICGNTFNNEFMRVLISRLLLQKSVIQPPVFSYPSQEQGLEVRFIRDGGLLGALGAYLNA